MKRIIIGTLALIVWGVILAFGIITYTAHKHPQVIVNELTKQISKNIDGITITASSINAILFPFPKIIVTDVIIRTNNNDLIYIEKILLFPDIIKMLYGIITLSSVELFHPTAILNISQKSPSLQEKDPPQTQQKSLPTDPLLQKQIQNIFTQILDTTIYIHSGNATLYTSKNALATFSNITSKISVTPNHTLSFLSTFHTIHFGPNNNLIEGLPSSLTMHNSKVEIKSIQISEDLLIQTLHNPKNIQWNTLLKKISATISSSITVGNTPTNLALVISAHVPGNNKKHEICGNAKVSGLIDLHGHPTMVAAHLPFSLIQDTNAHIPKILFKQGQIALDTDSLQFNGAITDYTPLSNTKINGTVVVRNLSLPRWFSFARNLPMGVQHALDHITGTLSFTLTQQGLDVPSIKAHTLGIPLIGSGSVTSFRDPIIKIDLETQHLNINDVIPELKDQQSVQVTYTMPPAFTSKPHTQPNTKTIGYDITIASQQAHFWNFDAGTQFVLHIHDNNKKKDPQIEAKYKNFYGGTLSSLLTVSNNTMLIDISLNNIHAEKPLATFTKQYQTTGLITAHANLTSSGKTIERFLANLHGTLSLSLSDACIKKKNFEQFFSLISINTTITNAHHPQNSSQQTLYTPYTGSWDILLKSAQWATSISMDGPVFFSTKNWLPVCADLITSTISYSPVGKEAIHANGLLSFNLEKNTFALTEFTEQYYGTKISGAITMPTISDSTIFEGHFLLTTPKGTSLFSQLGYHIPHNVHNEEILKRLTIQGNFYISPTNIYLKNIYGTIDETSFNLDLNGLRTEPPTWTGMLHIDKINLDKYILTKNDHTAPLSTKPWPTELLNAANIHIATTIDSLVYKKILHTGLTIPVQLDYGTLSLDPIHATLYEGTENTQLKITLLPSKKAQIQLTYTAQNVKIENLTTDLKCAYIIKGHGIFDITMESTAASSAEFVNNLNGNWNISAQNGSFNEVGSSNKNIFSFLGSTGTIKQGVAVAPDFALMGPGLSVKGSGTIDIPKWDINYDLIASTSNLPDIPITYYGNLNNPQYTIHASNLLLNTLGSLGTDTVGLMKIMLLDPIKIFVP